VSVAPLLTVKLAMGRSLSWDGKGANHFPAG
jgi:hypothetical protein